jgi:hypothetical protein
MANYFSYLPDLEYQSFLNDKTSDRDYVLVKNLFRRVKLRDDVYNSLTAFTKYQVPDGSRPDTVAEELYDDANYDWVVLITANIIHLRDEWPLSNSQLYNYAENKYGTTLTDIKFYETKEVRDSLNRLILPAGKIVSSNFTIPNPSNPNANLNPVNAVSNYEYETRLNDKKRNIYVLKPIYLQQFLLDMRTVMDYQDSSQYVSEKLIRTENTRITMP